MGGKRTEACGRCSMTSVVDFTSAERDSDEGEVRNPFGTDYIEVSEATMRRAAKPQLLLGRAKARLDAVAARITYGR